MPPLCVVLVGWSFGVVGGGSTIFALASGAGKAGVAVVRVSGPSALAALKALAPQFNAAPRLLRRVLLADPFDGAPLDDALAVWFQAPKSFTGEDIVELHLHGGRAVVAGVLEALGRIDGLRLAEPGQFTRRAFENGKIDLTEAEGLADLIDAATVTQRQQALKQMRGALLHTADAWRAGLVEAQALVEAVIDFSDEADVSIKAVDRAREAALRVLSEMRVALDGAHGGEIIREGYQVVIIGAPNVGKSSLLNALARREAAIVSPEAGTTRDLIELQLNLGGLAVVLVDTAGLRETDGAVEREGIRRGLERARGADLVLRVTDAGHGRNNFSPELHRLPDGFSGEVIEVENKADLLEARGAEAGDGLLISTATGEGLAALEARILELAQEATGGGETALLTTVRHRQLVSRAAAAVVRFTDGAVSDLELRAEDLRQAAALIGRLAGRVDAEEILGAIFSRFCIGK